MGNGNGGCMRCETRVDLQEEDALMGEKRESWGKKTGKNARMDGGIA